MCSLGEFIIKYALIISNIIFSLAGLVVAVLGIVTYIQLNQIREILPLTLSIFSIGSIVLGCVVFIIAYLACCGAIRQSICMLVSYAIFMGVLAAVKIYMAVLVFSFLEATNNTVQGWINEAFKNNNLRPVFNVMEELFRCCGTTGANSYTDVIPPSCCGKPPNMTCNANESFDGCIDVVSEWFQTFGGAIGAMLIIVIIAELVCMLFALNITNTIRNKRSTQTN